MTVDASTDVSAIVRALDGELPQFSPAAIRPVEIVSGATASLDQLQSLVRNFFHHGFAIAHPLQATEPPETFILNLGGQLGLGEPFVPELYRQGNFRTGPVARVSTDADKHPSFTSTGGLKFHCDATLQPIGMVKITMLYCQSQAKVGGETTLLNSTAAFADLYRRDRAAALTLASPDILIREANINDIGRCSVGPAIAVVDGRLASRYSVSETDRWNSAHAANRPALKRALAFMAAASEEGSPYRLTFALRAGQAILIDNSRIAHGRRAFWETEQHRRSLYRGLFLNYPDIDGRPQ